MKKSYTIISIVLLFAACLSTDKLSQKTMVNEGAFNKVGQKYMELHPCANDTTYKKGDTTHIRDTSYILAVMKDTVYKTVNYTDIKTVHDTAIVVDRELQKVLVHDTTKLNTTLTLTKIEYKDLKAKDDWHIVLIIALAVALIGSNGVWAYNKIFKI
jgi:hypothetical protein